MKKNWKRTGILLFCFLVGQDLLSQVNTKDLKLIQEQNFTIPEYEKVRVVKFGITNSRNIIVRNNPVTISLSALLYTYQKWLSRQISADCLFIPTCSEYSKQLFKRYGIIGGFITSADRLMRCDRISATTIHPISIDEHDGKVHESVDRYKLKTKSCNEDTHSHPTHN